MYIMHVKDAKYDIGDIVFHGFANEYILHAMRYAIFGAWDIS